MHSKDKVIKRIMAGIDFPMVIAQKNNILKIDKESQLMHPFFMGYISKVDEEYKEMRTEVARAMIHPTDENYKLLTQEILDEIQLRIGALIKIGTQISIANEVMMHNAKLISRGWDQDKFLRVRVMTR